MISKRIKYVFREGYVWYLLILVVLNLLPFLAPILLSIGETVPIAEFGARGIYFVYSFTCHQFAHRSLHINDYQCAWCTRDTGIWLGILTGAIFTRLLKITKGLKWYWLIPFVIPIVLDGGIQTIATIQDFENPFYISNNFTRFTTGAIFGIGISIWLSPHLLQLIGPENFQIFKVIEGLPPLSLKSFIQGLRESMLKFSTFLIVLLVSIYILLVGLWSFTSQSYPPNNQFDTEVRYPKNEFFKRRENGVCPTEGENIFDMSCFFQ